MSHARITAAGKADSPLMLMRAAAANVDVASLCRQWNRSITWIALLVESIRGNAPVVLGVLNPEEAEGRSESRA